MTRASSRQGNKQSPVYQNDMQPKFHGLKNVNFLSALALQNRRTRCLSGFTDHFILINNSRHFQRKAQTINIEWLKRCSITIIYRLFSQKYMFSVNENYPFDLVELNKIKSTKFCQICKLLSPKKKEFPWTLRCSP